MSTIIKSDDDCYFFFNATCTKGEACPFRHSDAAYGSDVVCSFWREGKCIKGASCKYRHMEIRKQRGKVECFFERQPGGCKKPHCPFLHKSTLKASNEDGSEITSESADIHSSDNLTPIKSSPFLSDHEFKGEGDISTSISENLKSCASPPFSPTSKQPGSPSSTVATIGSEPVSFNIDIAEESENEPEEVGILEKKPVKLTASNNQSGKNFGVKTLEQIRMEKVFKSNDVNKESPPEPQNTSVKVSRIKLKRKTLCTANSGNTTNDGTTGLNENETKPGTLGFGVKSLEEIRREKEQARKTSDQASAETKSSDAVPKKIIKIKRTHLETSKPDEPPSKLVKLRKPVSEDIPVATKSETKYNLIQSTDPPKVQSPENPTQRLQTKPLSSTPVSIKSTVPMPSPPKLGPVTSPVSSSPVSLTPIAAVSPQQQSQPNRVSIKTEIHKLKKHVSKQLNEIDKSDLGGKGLKTKSREQKSSSSIKKQDNKSTAVTNIPTSNTHDSQPFKKSKLSSSPSHDKSEWNEELCEKALGVEVNLLQKDEDFLEDDDLLDDENGETAPEDVNIEDEDDEFLKEIEHVINS